MLWHKFEFLFQILHLLNIFEIEKKLKKYFNLLHIENKQNYIYSPINYFF